MGLPTAPAVDSIALHRDPSFLTLLPVPFGEWDARSVLEGLRLPRHVPG